MKLKVLFEASPMVDAQKSGVGYYVLGLVSSLAANHPQEVALTGYFFNFLNRKQKSAPTIPGVSYRVIRFVPGKILSLCRRLHFQPVLELFTRTRSDIVLFTNYVSLPSLRNRKQVLVVYDLSFLDHPEYTQRVNLSFLQRFSARSIRRADLIITISEFTQSRLRHYFPDISADIVVTPIPPHNQTVAATENNDKLVELGIRDSNYLLHVGTIEPRKNLQALLQAYALLDAHVRANYALVLAGGTGWKNEAILHDIKQLQGQGLRIILAGYVTDAEKAALYAHASGVVVASHYEGFGMPILEAMQHGVPVALSDITVFHEVAAAAALYFDKDRPADIADTLTDLLTNQATRRQLIENARQQLPKFSWANNAELVFEAFQKITTP